MKTKQTTTSYSLGDFLIRVKNTAMAKNKTVEVTSNKKIKAVAESLKKLGFLDEVKKEGENLVISLAFKNKKPVLTNLKLISKPGLRIYLSAREIGKKRGPSQYLISTPKGILSSRQALKENLGGEIVAEIW